MRFDFIAVYMGDILALCLERRGLQLDSKNIDAERVMMSFKLPLNEIVVDFYDKLKSLTSGYASFDYEDGGYEASYLSKVTLFSLTYVALILSQSKHCP